MKRLGTGLLVIMAVLLICSMAMATMAWQKVLNDAYKPKAGTALAKGGCVVCHTKTGSPALNSFGTSLKGKAVSAASLKAVQKMDPDKDKYSNMAEAKAGTLPGDPKSKPSGKADCPIPKKK